MRVKEVHSNHIINVRECKNYFADNSSAYFVNGSIEPITKKEFNKHYKIVSKR